MTLETCVSGDNGNDILTAADKINLTIHVLITLKIGSIVVGSIDKSFLALFKKALPLGFKEVYK